MPTAARFAFPQDAEAKRRHLLAIVDSIADVIVADAAEADALRRLPAASARALRESGLFMLRVPAALGGAEADTATQIEVIERVAYHGSAAGWCLSICSALMGIVSSSLPDRGVGALFADGALPTAAGGGGMVPGPLEAVDGGYLLSGRWSWGSGIDHADWVVAPGLLKGESGAPDIILSCVLPRAAVTVHDNWHVMGLRGTGSSDFSVNGLFVPADFTYPHRGSVRDAKPVRGGPLYLLEMYAYTSPSYVGFVAGLARRALDEAAQIAQAKRRGSFASTVVTLADRQVFRRRLGEGDLKLRALKALMADLARNSFAAAARGEAATAASEAEIRAAGALAMEQALAVATDAFHYVGGSGVKTGHILERCLRDLHMASTHIWVSDISVEQHGEAMLQRA